MRLTKQPDYLYPISTLTKLLDKVRDDIAENKKLNYHLYMAVKKSLYKPGAFFKGFLFPLCQVPVS
jgi:hypothetical protein